MTPTYFKCTFDEDGNPVVPEAIVDTRMHDHIEFIACKPTPDHLPAAVALPMYRFLYMNTYATIEVDRTRHFVFELRK